MTAFQSKWGFHPCDSEVFKKIKLLHKHYWIAKKKIAAWERWWRKLPHNRVIRKPNGLVLAKPLPMAEPVVPAIYRKLVLQPIVVAYQQARHPQPTPETVTPMLISLTKINEWVAEIEKIGQKVAVA